MYCAGFPCQSFSVAGKRGGFQDTRGTLFFEVMRLAKERHPKYLLFENVPGLLYHNNGETFTTILNTLQELGYSNIEWQVIDSQYFGTVQKRKRVFVIGYYGEGNRQRVFPIQGRYEVNSRKRSADFRYDEGLRIRGDGTAPTLLSSNNSLDLSKNIILVDDNRYFTPLEYWRLQGFKDEHYYLAKENLEKEYKNIKVRKQLYKQAGNSVTVNVIEEIAKRLGADNDQK